jgi:hypothetical protein
MLIEPNRWTDYFAELSRHAEGYPTSIEILSDQLGDQVEARQAPLRELAFDPREGIAVSLGGVSGEAPVVLRHVIAAPTRVEATDEPGVPAALMIEDEDGVRTLLRLEPVTGRLEEPGDDDLTT